MSQISLFSPFDDCNEQTKTDRALPIRGTCMAPKLDAQTLFAFGVSYRKIICSLLDKRAILIYFFLH